MIAQKEVSTGRYADVGKSLGTSVARTISMRAELSNLEKLTTANTAIGQRFETMQAALGSVAETGESLLSSLISGSGTSVGFDINQRSATANIGQLVGALSGSFGSRYIFSGAKTDTPPIKADLAADYGTSAAFASVDAAWQAYVTANAGGDPAQITAAQMESFLANEFEAVFDDANWAANWSDASDNQTVSRIGENDMMRSSASANDQSFRNIMKSYVMLSNFSGESLADETRQVLASSSIETLSKGLSQLTDLRSDIGLGEERIERANEGLKVQTAILKIGIGEEEEIDIYEAKTRIDSLMNTLEMSYALTARVSRLSLLNFL
uniref:Flagellin n=1 Tax=Fulvimarina pelagi TaxID=217511 RepID=A0A0P0Z8Q2_9HYPH|nr:flagellar hook-associated protein L [Fulvimarina pelagi]